MKLPTFVTDLYRRVADLVMYHRADIAVNALADEIILTDNELTDEKSDISFGIIWKECRKFQSLAEARFKAEDYHTALVNANYAIELLHWLQDARDGSDLSYVVRVVAQERIEEMMNASQDAFAATHDAGLGGNKDATFILSEIQRRMQYVSEFDLRDSFIESAVASEQTIDLIHRYIKNTKSGEALAYVAYSLRQKAA